MAGGGAVVGALRVVLGADTAALDTGLKKSQAGLLSFGNAVGLGMAAVAAAVVAASVTIKSAITAAIDSADKLNSMSQAAGVSVEQLSKLSYAASLSGVDLDSLGNSMVKLSKAMVSAAGDGAGPASQAFTAMGIAVKSQNGSLKSSSDILNEIADKFANYKDGAQKTALATAIFGDAGAKLVPVLNQGSAGLKDLGNEADEFGLVLDKKTTLAAAAFNENLKKMDAIKQGLWTTVTAKLLPSFEMLSGQMLDNKKNSDLMSMAADGLVTAIQFVVKEIIVATVSFRGFVNELKAVWDVLAAPDWASFKDAWVRYSTVAGESEKQIQAVGDALKTAFSQTPSGQAAANWTLEAVAIKGLNREVASYAETWKQAAPVLAGAGQINALQSFLDSQSKKIASQNAETESIGKTADAQARLKVLYDADAIAKSKNITITDSLRASINAVADASAAAALKLQGAQLTQEMLAPWDLRNQKLQQYNTLLQAGAISQDTFTAASLRVQFPAFATAAQAAVDFGQRLGDLAVGAINGLSSALAAVITGTKSAAEAFKAFALQVITDLIAMVVKAVIFKAIMVAIGFSGGGPVSMEQSTGATGIGASGTGSLYAGGGSVLGPGTGTSDSIPAMLSDGEFVVNAAATKQWAPLLNAINSGKIPSFADGGDVSSQAEMPSMPSGGSKTVVLNGFMWGRDQMRDLFAFLNDGMRDGYKLQFAS